MTPNHYCASCGCRVKSRRVLADHHTRCAPARQRRDPAWDTPIFDQLVTDHPDIAVWLGAQ